MPLCSPKCRRESIGMRYHYRPITRLNDILIVAQATPPIHYSADRRGREAKCNPLRAESPSPWEKRRIPCAPQRAARTGNVTRGCVQTSSTERQVTFSRPRAASLSATMIHVIAIVERPIARLESGSREIHLFCPTTL